MLTLLQKYKILFDILIALSSFALAIIGSIYIPLISNMPKQISELTSSNKELAKQLNDAFIASYNQQVITERSILDLLSAEQRATKLAEKQKMMEASVGSLRNENESLEKQQIELKTAIQASEQQKEKLDKDLALTKQTLLASIDQQIRQSYFAFFEKIESKILQPDSTVVIPTSVTGANSNTEKLVFYITDKRQRLLAPHDLPSDYYYDMGDFEISGTLLSVKYTDSQMNTGASIIRSDDDHFKKFVTLLNSQSIFDTYSAGILGNRILTDETIKQGSAYRVIDALTRLYPDAHQLAIAFIPEKLGETNYQ